MQLAKFEYADPKIFELGKNSYVVTGDFSYVRTKEFFRYFHIFELVIYKNTFASSFPSFP